MELDLETVAQLEIATAAMTMGLDRAEAALEEIRQRRLAKHGFACLMRAGHPLWKKRLTVDDFLRAEHVVVRPEGRSSEEILEDFYNGSFENRGADSFRRLLGAGSRSMVRKVPDAHCWRQTDETLHAHGTELWRLNVAREPIISLQD